MAANNISIQGVKFEEGYMFKNSRVITSTADVAITELVANAWDAGAYNVNIEIPQNINEEIYVEDNGVGMSDKEFRNKWMTLNYDRQKRQGKGVVFPPKVDSYKRIAYGRNGIGRHGMLCFSDSYTVETWKNGTCNKYSMSISAGVAPYEITHHSSFVKQGYGTKVSTYINRNLPNAEEMTDIISARFLYDPKFNVAINGKTVDLLNHKGFHDQEELIFKNDIKLRVTIIDSTKTSLKSQQHGIAFWIGGRLVGKPSWSHGKYQFLDGRFKAAKRYTLVVESDDLMDYVLPDWTGFYNNLEMNEVYRQFKKYVDSFINSIMTEQVRDLQMQVIEEKREELEMLPTYEKREVSSFIETITTQSPMISPDFMKTAVEAMISIEKSKSGERLLAQISKMAPKEMDKLSELLAEWDIEDVLSVLHEIDKRIVVVQAISKLCDEKSTDELHTLHPLLLNARWLFGAEFDSPMYVSNKELNSFIRTLFKNSEYDLDALKSLEKRSDIIFLKHFSLKAVCTDRIDNYAGGVMKPDQILIIELKRSSYTIEAREISQTEHYIEQIKESSASHNSASIQAFVVGSAIGGVDCHNKTESGTIDVVTYGQLVETATTNLFRLRTQLIEHYESIGDQCVIEKALAQPKQLKM